jgi:hypothetical protein
VTANKDEHLEKQYSPRDATEFGIATGDNESK